MAAGTRPSVAVLLLAASVALSGCQRTAVQPPTQPPVGADRDAHGCIGSAGYAWCAREDKCVRPWELAKEKNLSEGAEAVERYCSRIDAP
jgi:hypothetical protein